MKEETCHKMCKYEFDEKEKREIAAQMAEASAKSQDLEIEKKEVAATIKARIETNTKELHELGKQYRDGYEWRSLECRREYDYEGGMVRVYRKDTGEIVEERGMTTSERQPEIPITQ